MKRNLNKAFTLIELLAVIVILAIIALIATPIILGIVEDARKDSFERSVELVISATDLDVMNKLTDTGYRYDIVDGKIVQNKTFVKYVANKDSQKCRNGIEAYMKFQSSEQGEDGPSEEEKNEMANALCSNEEIQPGMTYIDLILKELPSSMEKVILNDFISYGVIQEEWTYEELNIAKNTNGMNGYIQYNKTGKEVYAIHNGIYCVTKEMNMDKAEVSKYVEGECNADLIMKFPEFINVSSGGDRVVSGNGQLINLGKYGVRYQGTDPDNYVYFNCNDYSNQTEETCELWRIIGVVDGKIKILSTQFGEKEWNDLDDDNTFDQGIEINDWNNSALKTYLNGEEEGDYYASLTEATKLSGLISPSTWYLRAMENNDSFLPIDVTTSEMYDIERTTGVILHDTPQIDNTNIGIMYPSDWGFATLESNLCPANTYLTEFFDCNGSNWIAQDLEKFDSGSYEWLISPFKAQYYFESSVLVNFRGNQLTADDVVATRRHYYRPTLYLSSNVELQGEGTIDHPYQLSIIN